MILCRCFVMAIEIIMLIGEGLSNA
jgi:hypothetical protein